MALFSGELLQDAPGGKPVIEAALANHCLEDLECRGYFDSISLVIFTVLFRVLRVIVVLILAKFF